jgi:rubrerythrin
MTVTNTTSGEPGSSASGTSRTDADAFDHAREGLEAYRASVDERELVEVLSRHGKEEGQMLATYARFASSAPSASARYLVSLILDDERRHHRLLGEIANAIGWSWEGQSRGLLPDVEHGRRESSEALIKETRALLREEERDKKELRRLRRKLEPYENTTVWALLVDLMIHDTEKHARILRFILDHEG